MVIILTHFAISFLIGLLLGMERERSHPEGTKAIGVRTFILFAIMGTLAATLNQPIITATLSSFAFGIILVSYFQYSQRTKIHPHFGITTEVAAGIVFALGYLVVEEPLIAIVIGSVMLIVLMERKRLHQFSRTKLNPHEMEVAIILIIFALGIVPILPNQTIDQWNLFNPRKFGMLIALIAGIQFAGYVAIQLFGQRLGRAIMGFFGGLVSSTAVYATLSSTLGKTSQLMWATAASAILAILAMIIEVGIIVFVASPTLFIAILWPLVTMAVVCILFAIIMMHYQKIVGHPHFSEVASLNLLSIFKSVLLISIILLLIALINHYLSTQWIMLASFLGGLFEIHSISLATSLLFINNKLSIYDAQLLIAIAISATFISKLFLLWTLTPRYFAWRLSAVLLVVWVSGFITFWFTT